MKNLFFSPEIIPLLEIQETSESIKSFACGAISEKTESEHRTVLMQTLV